LTDWGWFNLFESADSLTAGWGRLADLNFLSFDWLRVSDSHGLDDPVWQAQSVAFRIYLRSGSGVDAVFSELVWESIYNHYDPVPRDRWIVEDITNQLFWRFVTGDGYTLPDCTNVETVTSGFVLKVATPSAWGNGSNCMSDATVYGIGVGVGSNWPYPFQGFADNVQLAFLEQGTVVHDNFELAEVPEPGTLLLAAIGLAGIATVHATRSLVQGPRRRRRGT
jgi:hypothetical protein